MKKFFILFAAVALMAMTACNEKPARQAAEGEQPATEQADTAKSGKKPVVDVEKAKPTEDGKDHIVGEFKTKEYQVRIENLADGTYRVSMWKANQDKSEKPDQMAESKKCVMKDGAYLMQTADGKNYVISTKAGSESLIIMDEKGIIYSGKGVK